MADVYFFKGAAESIVEHCHERACYKPTCEWNAQIMVGGKFRHLGYFKGTAAGERTWRWRQVRYALSSQTVA
jgi:hypothetical protein